METNYIVKNETTGQYLNFNLFLDTLNRDYGGRAYSLFLNIEGVIHDIYSNTLNSEYEKACCIAVDALVSYRNFVRSLYSFELLNNVNIDIKKTKYKIKNLANDCVINLKYFFDIVNEELGGDLIELSGYTDMAISNITDYLVKGIFVLEDVRRFLSNAISELRYYIRLIEGMFDSDLRKCF